VRTYSLFLIGIGAFFGVIGLVYWFWGYEDGGFLMLIGTALLGIFPGSYYLWWSHHMKLQPDDDPDADVAEGAGDIGSFPASSIWPFFLGMGALFATLTFVLGLWFAPIAATLLISGAIGGTVESRHGGTVVSRPPAAASQADSTSS
jgi:hypothetical protein